MMPEKGTAGSEEKIETSMEQIQAMSDEEHSELTRNVEKMKLQDSTAQAEKDRQKKEEEDRLVNDRAEKLDDKIKEVI